MAFILITDTGFNRVIKYVEFATAQEAQDRLDSDFKDGLTLQQYFPNAFIYDNVNSYAVEDLWVDNQVVTHVPIDKLPETKEGKIEQLKLEALERANAVFGEVVFINVGSLRLLEALFNSFQSDGSTDPLLISVNSVRIAFQDAKDAINALTTVAEVEAYDVVNTPAWP